MNAIVAQRLSREGDPGGGLKADSYDIQMNNLTNCDTTEDENLKVLEEKSWEELRMKHREIETQVNEEELINMKEVE